MTTSGFFYQYATSTGTIDSNASALALLNGTGVASNTTGNIDTVTLPAGANGDNFAIRYTGTVNVSAGDAGTWYFEHDADDALTFIVNGVVVATRWDDSTGGVSASWSTSSSATLNAGANTIEIVYWEEAIGQFVNLSASPSGTAGTFVPVGGPGGLAVQSMVANTAPTFTSGAIASVAEGTTVAYDATATDDSDSEGSGITYALAGSGVDNGDFTIDAATGVVSFASGPDFEAPADDDTDNTYNITVRATDSNGAFTDQAVAITVTNVAPTGTVTATPSGPFTTGDVITFTATFDENVTASGSALTLTGGHSANQTGNSLNTVTFAYTVQAGDNQADLEVTGYTGTITDGTAAATLAPTNLDIVLDTTAPAAPGTPDLQATSDSNIDTDENTNVTAPVFDVDVSMLAMNDTVTLVDTSNGNAALSAVYTVTGSEMGGTAQITANTLTAATYAVAAVSADTLGNTSAPSAALSVVIDTDADLNDDATIAFTGAGSDMVYGGTEVVSVAVSGLDMGSTGSLTITGTAGNVMKSVTANGTVALSLAESASLGAGALSASMSITDVAGNTASAPMINSFNADYVAPTASSAMFNMGAGTAGAIIQDDVGTGTVTLAVTFDEAMDDTVNPTVTITTAGTGLSESATVARAWNAAKTILTITYDLADTNADLADVSVSVSGAQDAAGNMMTGATPLSTGAVIDTEISADQSASFTPNEIADQAQATAGVIDLATLDGTDGTTYALATFPVNPAHAHVEFDGLTLRIKDDAAARAYFDAEVNPSINIMVTGTDNAGNITQSTLSFALQDLNDAPQQGTGDYSDTVTERADGLTNLAGDVIENDTPFGTAGTFTVTDDEVGDTHSVTVSNIVSNAPGGVFLGFFQAGFDDPITGDGTGTVGWDFNVGLPFPETVSGPQMAIIDALAEGESIVQEYDVVITETNNAPNNLSYVQRVVITIDGTNDAPVVSGSAISGAVTEVADPSMADQTLTAEGTLNVVDTDTTDTVSVDVTSVAVSGSFTGTNPLSNTQLEAFMSVVAGDGSADPAVAATGLSADANPDPALSGSDFTWKFSAGSAGASAFDFLNAGQTLVLEYTLTATDDNTVGTPDTTDTQVVTITVTGSNDVPTITAASTATGIVEAGVDALNAAAAGTDTVSGMLNAYGNWADADAGETAALEVTQGSAGAGVAQTDLTFDQGPATDEAAIFGTYGTLYVKTDGSYRYELDNTDADTQALDGGDTVSDVFNYTIANGTDAGDSAASTLTVAIAGTNDAPVLTFATGADTGAVTEAGVDAMSMTAAGTPSATGTFAATDIDANDTTLTWTANANTGMGQTAGATAAEITGTYGTFSVTSAGVWSFDLANGSTAVQSLYQGESVSESFEVQVSDGNGGFDTQSVMIDITGTNDAPVVSVTGAVDNAVIEAGDDGAGDAVATGAFAVTDADNDAPTTDDDAKIWSIITNNDGPVTPAVANGAAAIVTGTYGTLSLTSLGTWSYALLNNDADTQALDDGGTATDMFTVRVADGLGGHDDITVTVNVAGDNDAPVISVETGDAITADLVEDAAATLTASDTLTITDVDANEGVSTTVTGLSISGITGAYGSNATPLANLLSITDGGTLTNTTTGGSNQATWTFSAASTLFDYLAKDEVLTLVYTVTSNDTTSTDTQTVTVTVTGTNDTPTVSAETGDSAAETVTESTGLVGGNLQTAGTLSIADLDTTDTHTPAATLATATWTDLNGTDPANILTGPSSSAGTISATLMSTLDNAFTVTNTANNVIDWDFDLADTEVDFLGKGEELVLVFNVTAQDDSLDAATDTSVPQTVTITIVGSDDAPVLSAAGTSAFDEGNSNIIVDGAVTGTALADDVTVNLLGTGSNDADNVWVTTVTTELDTNDARTITGTPTITTVSGTIPAGYTQAMVEAAFGGLTAASDAVTFNRNAAVFDALDDAAFIDVTLAYTVRTTSPDGTTFVDTPLSTVVRINGDNDAPFITDGAALDADVTEDGMTAVGGNIFFNDIEPTDRAALSVTNTPTQSMGTGAADLANYIGTFSAGFSAPTASTDGLLFYTFSVDNSVINNLAEGEVFTQSYEIAITDGDLSTTRDIVITFTGVNDAPANIAVTGATGLTENTGVDVTGGTSDQQLTGTITFDDADISDLAAGDPAVGADTHTVTSAFKSATLDGAALTGYAGAMGDFTITAASITAANAASTVGNSVDWTFDIDDADFDHLAAGEVLALTYTVTIDDGATGGSVTQDITVSVTGTNDSPSLTVETGNTDARTVTEGDAALSTSGTLTLADADLSDLVSVTTTSVAVTSGDDNSIANATLLAMLGVTDTLSATEASEQVTWNFNSGTELFDYLSATDTLVLTYTLTASDNATPPATTTQNVVITINGTNDVPVIAGTASNSVAEDAMDLTASGTLTITDKDTGESTFQAIAANTAGDNAYGTFEVGTNGAWTYTLTNTLAAVQNLGVGATLTDTITVTSADGSATQDLIVTITGTNDAPVIDESLSELAKTTDEDVAVTGTISVDDRDLDNMGMGDTLTYSISTDGANGTASIDASGEYTYTPGQDFNGADSFIVTVADGQGGMDTVTVNITIDPINDAPVGNVVPSTTFPIANEDQSFSVTVVNGAPSAMTDVPLALFATDVEGNISPASLAFVSATIGGTAVADLATAGITYTGATGVFTFDGAVAAYQTLAESVTTDVVINFTVTDDASASDTGSVTFTVRGTNDAPVLDAVASALTPTGAEDAITIGGSVVATDTDLGDTRAYTIEASDGPANGTVTINENTGAYSYVPNANYNGTDAFTVTITDDENAVITTLVNVTVSAVNDATEINTTAQVTPTHVEAVDAATPVATLVADAVTLVDVDALDYDTAVLSAAVTGGDASDVLSLDTSGTVSVSGTDVSVGGTTIGTLATTTAGLSVTFNASAMQAQVESVLQALSYATTSDQPATTRAITLDLTDGDGGTAMQQSVSVNITASNDTPSASDFDLAGVNEDSSTTLTIVSGLAGAGEVSLSSFGSDPDGNIDVSSVTFPGTVTAGGVASDFATLGLSYNAVTGEISVDTTVAFYQDLDAADTLELLIDFTLTDGATATDTGVMTVDVTGVNDRPTLTAVNLATYTDTNINNAFTNASGTLMGADADADDTTLSYALDAGTMGSDPGGSFTTQTSAFGTLKLYTNGSYDFAVDAAAVNAAPDGGNIVLDFGVVVSDGNGAANSDSTVTNVTITIDPANDTPEIAAIAAKSIADTANADTIADITGVAGVDGLTAVERDTGDTVDFSISGKTVVAGETSQTFYYDRSGATVVADPSDATGLIELGTLTVTTAGGYTFDANDAGIDALRAGENPAISTMLRATDDDGLFTETALAINVTGANDAPVVGGIVPGATITAKEQLEGTDTRATAEGDAVEAQATISYTDVDSTGTPNFAFIPAASGFAGTISFTPSGGTVADGNVIVSFEIPDADLNALAEGEELLGSPQEYEIRIFDEVGSFVSQTVFINIVGSNDRPVISAAAGQEGAMVTEAAEGASDSTLTANGTLSVTDEDTTDDVTLSVTDLAVSGSYTGDSAPSDTALKAMLGFAAGAGATTGFTPTLTLAADGANTDASWGFTSGMMGDDAFKFLAAGETLVLAYEVTANDNSETAPGVATDTATTTQTITVTITGTNDGPVAAGDIIANVAEDLDIGAMTPTVIATAFANDTDDKDTLVYSIDAGDPDGLFAINSATGAITLAAGKSLDAEAMGGGQHVLSILVDDQNGGTDTQQVTVNVSDVDDNITTTPVDNDTAFFATGNVNENAAIGTAVGITAMSTDDDVTANPLAYSITGGTGSSLFTIDSSTGVITVNGAIDREAAGGGSYTLDVIATPQSGAASAAATFTITVNDDITEFSVSTPVDTDGTTGGSLAENSMGGAIVGITAFSSDSDATLNTVTYALTDNAGNRFEIDATSGVVTLSDEAGAPALNFEAAPSHNITIEATSADGTTATETFTIAVTDADDTPPVITSANTATPDENQTAVLTLTATDVDSDASQTSYSLVGGADMGAFEIINGNELVFKAAPDFEVPTDAGTDGTYNVTVQATDVLGNSSTQDITVTVQDVNEAPEVTLANGQITIAENTPTTGGIKVADIIVSDDALGTNDLDLDGADAADFEIRTGPSGPELFFIGTSPNFETASDDNTDGVYNVTVTVDDTMIGTGDEDTAAFTLSVTDVAEAPVATDNVSLAPGNIAENSTFTVTLSAAALPAPLEAALSALATDEDGDIDLTSLSFDTATLDGVATTVAALGVSYDGSTGVFTLAASGPSFESLAVNDTAALVVGFTVTDGTGLTDTGSLNFTVSGINDAPVVDLVASDLAASGDEDTVINGTIVATDVDAGSTRGYTIAAGDGATNGTVTIDLTTGAYTYTPDANFNGADSFTVTITDDQMVAVTQVVGVTVAAVDDAPDATTGTATTNEDAAIMIDVTSFVTEVDGDDFTVTAASVPETQGSLSFSGKIITFTPAANSTGPVTITYTVSDATGAALNDSDTINVTITALDDAPVAADGTANIMEDAGPSVIDVASLITEVDGDAITVTATVPAAQGGVTVSGTEITFTPADDFNGTASITYTVTDTAGGLNDAGVVAVAVAAVNDATEIDTGAQLTPTHVEAVDAAAVVPTLIADAVTLVDVDNLDYDTAVLSASVAGGDLTDILSVDTSGTVDLSELGVLSVGGVTVGALGLAATGSISFTFNATAQKSDVQAVLQALSYATVSDQPVTSRTITLSLTDGDGLAAMNQTVDVTITASNDTPTPQDDAISAVEGGTLSTLNLLNIGTLDSDPDGDALTVTGLADLKDATGDAATGGSATVGSFAGVITTDWGAQVTLQSNGSLFYNLSSPTARFNELAEGDTAVDSFTYTVSDGNLTETATVSVTITGVNDNITANPDTITATENTATSVTGNLLDNDTDRDVGDIPEIVSVASSVSATAISTATGYLITTVDGVVVSLERDGNYQLTAPDSLDAGTLYTATFQYTAQDDGPQSTTTVTINITGDNDGPAAATVTLTASDEDTVRTITSAQLLTGATDPDANAALTITDLTLTSGNGTLDDNGDGTWAYTPALNDNSAVTFSYTVSDGTLTATSTAGLDLTPVNDAPVDNGTVLAVSGDEDTAITGTILASDVDGDTLAYA
ncbi:VCBS domain-containing protein, partial [uncultured Sulfitobacter sp.]|uniref:VCBS domain-containing protein n=1 Tax=uncultured Sulfitobacter sp. TaxID=191468 RepID=UPI002610339C